MPRAAFQSWGCRLPVDARHPEYENALPDWRRNRDVVEGERAVKAAGYLPRLAKQSDSEYAAMKDRAYFFPATSRTLDGLTGLIFRKDPQAELPAAIKAYTDDINLQGQSIAEFAQKITDDIMQAPHGGILVEYPRTDGAELVKAAAEAMGLRPYATFYPAEKVINWRTSRVSNRMVITEVRLLESVEEADPKDPWGRVTVEQIRVLALNEAGVYEVAIFQKRRNEATAKTDWVEADRFVPYFRGAPSRDIPFVFIGPRDTSSEVQKAPLTDISGVNIGHYRNSADYENGLHWTGCPTPVFLGDLISGTGEQVTEVRIGSTSGIQMSQGSDAKFLEFEGSGLSALKTALDDKKTDMALLGARILASDRKQTEAAETAAIHRAGENSVLASLAGSVSKGIEKALQIMAAWVGVDGAQISYRLNTDYQPAAMSFNDLSAIVGAWQSGAISKIELFESLQAGEIIRDDKAYDEHAAELEAEEAARDEGDEEALAAAAARVVSRGAQ